MNNVGVFGVFSMTPGFLTLSLEKYVGPALKTLPWTPPDSGPAGLSCPHQKTDGVLNIKINMANPFLADTFCFQKRD